MVLRCKVTSRRSVVTVIQSLLAVVRPYNCREIVRNRQRSACASETSEESFSKCDQSECRLKRVDEQNEC